MITRSELYRDAEGHEVWRILDANTGAVLDEDIASDHDHEWIVAQIEARGAQA